VSASTRVPGPASGLLDSYARVATDLRVSLTDRCNLRCSYCMPAEGLDWLPTDETLSDDEVVRLVRIGVEQLGIEEVRFTGGEPLLRRGLADIVARTKALEPTPEVSITTNALGLSRTAEALARAGLDRVNVSLDTIRRDVFKQITLRDRLDDVLDGLAAARSRSTRCCCAESTTTSRPSCCTSVSSTTTSCGSSSRCPSTPSTAGRARRW
jgi:cyclic pyranopterin phosphate synthase